MYCSARNFSRAICRAWNATLFSSVRCASSVSNNESMVLVIEVGVGPSRGAKAGARGVEDEASVVLEESESRKALRSGEVLTVTGSSSRMVENVIWCSRRLARRHNKQGYGDNIMRSYC